MSFRPPDWHQRLRELEQRADNLTTDVSRLWQMAPQAPEMPGFAMPVIIPSATTPTPTTTTTSTTTTSTSTTPSPTCNSAWRMPSSVSINMSGISGNASGGCHNNENGSFILSKWSCNSSNIIYKSSQVSGGCWPGSNTWVVHVAPAGVVGYFAKQSSPAPYTSGVVYSKFQEFDPIWPETPDLPSGVNFVDQVGQWLKGKSFSIPVVFYPTDGYGYSSVPSNMYLMFSS